MGKPSQRTPANVGGVSLEEEGTEMTLINRGELESTICDMMAMVS